MTTLIDEKILKDLERVIDISSSPGKYDYSPYLLGLANGLILAKAIITGENPVYLVPPKVWGVEKEYIDKKEQALLEIEGPTTVM